MSAYAEVRRPKPGEPADRERLLEGASQGPPPHVLLTLLGGDAGLRIGEAIALEWTDIDFKRRLMTVARSEWQGAVSAPKGGQSRTVPLTTRLVATLEAQRNLGPGCLPRTTVPGSTGTGPGRR